MIEKINNYRAFAEKLLNEIQSAGDPADVYKRLCGSETKMREISLANFRVEFHALLLAFATLQWQELCEENRLGEEAIQRAFLRAVTQSFQSPQTLGFAEIYSGYLHSSAEMEPDSPTILRLAARFFHRLGQNELLKKDRAQSRITPAFSDLVFYLEGFKSSFSNHFNTFVTANLT